MKYKKKGKTDYVYISLSLVVFTPERPWHYDCVCACFDMWKNKKRKKIIVQSLGYITQLL